jgi:phage shock protein C
MSEATKKLYRSRTERWLAGVCGGLGEYFGIDPTLVRVIFVLFALTFGSGFLIYLVLWIIIPLEPETPGEIEIPDSSE